VKKVSFLILALVAIFILGIYVLEKSKPTYQEVEGEQMEINQNKIKIDQGMSEGESEMLTADRGSTVEEETNYIFAYQSIPEPIKETMKGVSWQEKNPVSLEDLSYVQVAYWGFDGEIHQGEIIVHQQLALEVQEIFRELYEAKFPIEKMVLIDEYNGDDESSMADNNTSAFCSRPITGKQNVYSKHSYGVAIDINPVQNPYQKGELILPPIGEVYLDRSKNAKGMIQVGDPCYTAFISRGWSWGGDWIDRKDYHHFEKNIPNS